MPGGNRRASGPVTNNCSVCLPGPGRAPVRPVMNNCSGYLTRQRPGTGFRRAGGDAAGEDPGKHPGVPRCQHPEPEQLFPIPDPEDPEPEDPDVVNPDPDDIITRTILRFTPIPASCSPKPDPEPRISRTFPDEETPDRPRQTIQLFCWAFAICCYWDLFGFYGNFCWCDVFHAIFSTFHKFLQLFNDLITG